MKRAVMIGAGQIGRGFIGMLLSQSGYHVTFADVDMAVVDDINQRGEYTVHLVDEQCIDTKVSDISALVSGSQELVEEYAQCQLICTSVGLNVLPVIAPAIAKGISRRYGMKKTEPLNIIACENAIRATSTLKAEVQALLSAEEREYAAEYVGFPDCAVDRIIPPHSSAHAAEVYVERYHEWDVEKKGFIGKIPNIAGMNVVEELEPYLERKLFTLNGPNAVTGCYGYLKGYKTVNEALKDPEIYVQVIGMMEECGAMLVQRHGFAAEDMEQYRLSLMQRFMNPYIIDDCCRVAREPIRKLSPNDRIIAAMNYAHSYGIDTPHYYTGVALVLTYDNPSDRQSCEIQELLRTHGVRKTLESICAIPAESRAALAIEGEYMRLKSLQGES